MFRLIASLSLILAGALGSLVASAQTSPAPWTFAVSGDSRNCGDFVMPAIAAKVKAESDAFYWHLGDFRWISSTDQDLEAMQPPGSKLSRDQYLQRAWDDFLEHQIAAFGSLPVFLGRGNHEDVKPMTREGYIAKFSSQSEPAGDCGAAESRRRHRQCIAAVVPLDARRRGFHHAGQRQPR